MTGSESRFQISPETKIGALLEKFQDLEKPLLEMAPEFKKLKNPVLRKTMFSTHPLFSRSVGRRG
jgi:hypothetical protein